MQRFRKILFTCDPTRCDPSAAAAALQRAIQTARLNEAQLTVANVSAEIPRSLTNHEAAFLKAKEEQLLSLLSEVSSEKLDVRMCQLTGTPFMEIINQVARGCHDLVIKTAEGRGRISSMLFGSTDLHLFRKCPCPVWIIKPSQRKKHYARLLAAVDPTPGVETNAELNALILDLATSLAQREGSELHIVHAWSMPYESMLRSGRGYLPKSEVNRMVRDTRRSHKQWLDQLVARYDLKNLSAKIHLLKGDPGEVIPILAQKKRVGLIVMGTVARTGIPGFIIGNTAEKTLGAVNCSVLAVKPRSFATPVEI